MSSWTLPVACTQCGICREVCLAEQLGGHTITSLLSGGETFSSWLCSCCWLCQEACPEAVDIHELMIAVRRDTEPSDRYQQAYESVKACGYAFRITDEINDLRASFELGPVVLISPGRLQLLLVNPEVDREQDGQGADDA